MRNPPKNEEEKQQQLQDALWDRFLDLQSEVNRPNVDLARIQTDLEAVIAEAKQILPRSKRRQSISHWDLRRCWLQHFYFILGYCHERRSAFTLAEKYFRQSLGDNAHHYEDFARFFIRRGRMKEAALVLQKTPLWVMRTEEDSTAIHYLNWMFQYPSLRKHLPKSTITNWLKVLIEAAPRVALRNLTIHIATTEINEIGD